MSPPSRHCFRHVAPFTALYAATSTMELHVQAGAQLPYALCAAHHACLNPMWVYVGQVWRASVTL